MPLIGMRIVLEIGGNCLSHETDEKLILNRTTNANFSFRARDQFSVDKAVQNELKHAPKRIIEYGKSYKIAEFKTETIPTMDKEVLSLQ